GQRKRGFFCKRRSEPREDLRGLARRILLEVLPDFLDRIHACLRSIVCIRRFMLPRRRCRRGFVTCHIVTASARTMLVRKLIHIVCGKQVCTGLSIGAARRWRSCACLRSNGWHVTEPDTACHHRFSTPAMASACRVFTLTPRESGR